ncbi:CBS domain-containing protein [Oscillatoria sp. FACHB-1407]|uniref:CBS domain-containing protein n=1 Tax=Oscillatoria sp. FACHB-1407 TaxID=2692847 RepID=UPI001689A3E0|nr:CBS domain-containing protein [Oscillatoria sp. FACHB-1407]MBD2464672.1 CBS domain-containing protein [Oscillatoria sp. FACHB-1407]
MQLESLSAYLPSLETTIDSQPTLVAPGTPLIEVIARMSQVTQQQCILPTDSNSAAFDSALLQASSAVLVVEQSKLIGIFTEHDLVKLTAAQTQWRDLKIEDVMSHPVVTLTKAPALSLLAALSIFREYKIRHLPVLDEQGNILGLISSGSIRKALQPLNMLKWKQVRDVMTCEVVSAPASTNVLTLTQLMIQHQVSSIVLTQSDIQTGSQSLYAVGLITERDIVQYQALELDLSSLRAEAVMSTPLFQIHPSDPLLKAQQLMQQHRIRRLVVTGEQGELKGIVTQGSLLRVFDPLEMYELLEFLHQTVERRTTELHQINQKLQTEILERELVESHLRETLLKEQELNQFRSYVTAMASHDLRLPLTNISMAAELLQLKGNVISEAKREQYLDRIRLAVKQMNVLLNDIVTISEVESGKLDLNSGTLELVQFCQTLIEEIHLATQSKCVIQFNCGVAEGMTTVDEKVLRQILVNLLSNAVKYSPAGTTVTFDLLTEADHVVFRIQDQGIGIPEKDQEQLFEPFYRASNAHSFEGTGLGLAIVKRCVDAYQGAIALTSQIGSGTLFTIRLPLVVNLSQVSPQ